MQFSKQLLSTLAFILLAVPALAADTVPRPTPQQAKEVNAELQTLGTAIQKELEDCIAAPGENTAECFNRQAGMNLDSSKPMTNAEIQAATGKYSHLVGESLANCTRTKGFYVCLDEIKNADDKARFNFKRGFGTDFMAGFKKGFVGTLKFATSFI